ncbi:hypothetical protein WA538_004777 [Blastocystis sp. DL]
MDSRRKRKEKPLIAEDLIMSGVNQESTSYEHKTNRSNSEATEKRKHSLIFQDLDDNTEDIIISKQHDGKCGCMDERSRLYIITCFTLVFGIFSFAFGIWLVFSEPRKMSKLQSGVIAIIISVLLFAPASYGITRIIQSISKSREKKQSSRLKDENFTYHQTVTV